MPLHGTTIKNSDRVTFHRFYDHVAISTLLCLMRLQWAGHIVRKDESRITKKWEDVSEEEGTWGRLEVDGNDAVWRDAAD